MEHISISLGGSLEEVLASKELKLSNLTRPGLLVSFCRRVLPSDWKSTEILLPLIFAIQVRGLLTGKKCL